ncbi:MAG: hypothetical protein RJQ08_13575 [Salinisphaeraceae bacterium]
MKKLLTNIGALVLTAIPVAAMLALFEIVTFVGSYKYMGFLVAGYLILVLSILTYKILQSLFDLIWPDQRNP